MDGLDRHLAVLGKLMSAASLRHGVLAGNLANVNTPGYRAREVRFESTLRAALRRGGDLAGAVRETKAEIREREGAPAGFDGNTVSLETEFGEVSKNAALYAAYARFLAIEASKLRSAVTGRSV